MKKQSAFKLISLIISFGLLTSCGKIPDVPVCEALEQRLVLDPATKHLLLMPDPVCMKEIKEAQCGHCTYIISGRQVYVGEDPKTFLNKKPWSVLRPQCILVPAEESYAPLSAHIINSCKKAHCDKEVEGFKIKLDSLNGVNGAIHNGK